MNNDTTQFQVGEGIREILLAGPKLPENTNDLNVINRFGDELYSKNRQFIKEKIPDTWFAVIEPMSGKLIASNNQIKLYEYTREHYSGKLFYIIGLLRASGTNFIYAY